MQHAWKKQYISRINHTPDLGLFTYRGTMHGFFHIPRRDLQQARMEDLDSRIPGRFHAVE